MKIVTTRKRKQVKPRQLRPISPNTHLQQLSAFFSKVSQHSSNLLIQKINKKLRTTLSNMVPIKTSQLTDTHVNVVVSKVLDDDKCVFMPKVDLVCLKISKQAEEKIKRFGGRVYKLDEIFKFDLNNCVLLQNEASRRIKSRYYGSAGDEGSKTKIKKMFKKKDVTKRPS